VHLRRNDHHEPTSGNGDHAHHERAHDDRHNDNHRPHNINVYNNGAGGGSVGIDQWIAWR